MVSRLFSLIIGILFLFLSFNLNGQIYIMGESGGLITTCSGSIENPGGYGSYADGLDVNQTICSGNGQCINLTFSDFETESCCDILTVYDGISTASNVIEYFAGTLNSGTTLLSNSNSGCITLQFHSDGSIPSTGFRANISCLSCPSAITLGEGGDSILVCSTSLIDPGGFASYSNNENVTQTFCAADSGSCLSISFLNFNTELNADILSIYNGPDTNSELIGHFSGTTAPPSITSSYYSQGCLTFNFISNQTVTNAGFQAYLNCQVCQDPIIIMGQSEDTVFTCGTTILDPGAWGNYDNDQHVSQTICAETPDQCINLSFSSFNLEATVDKLYIYDGPSIYADLIGVFTGNSIPVDITGSTNSEGCLTLLFVSDNQISSSGFEADVTCGICIGTIHQSELFCSSAKPICLDSLVSYSYYAPTYSGPAFSESIYCLGSTVNPTWLYFQVSEAGSIGISLTGEFDMDFICWGPFTETEWNAGVCNNVMDLDWASNPFHVIDCSYSGSAQEIINISDANVGEFYLFMTCNYSNLSQIVTLQKYSGQGSINCSSVCDHSVNVLVSECDSTTNTYSISSTLYIPHPPLSGTMSVINSSGGMFTLNAPFPDSLNFSFDQLASDGQDHFIQVVISEASNCVNTFSYTAPLACNACSVSASLLDTVNCTGLPIQLQATDVPGANYNWTGPNGFTSSEQNPILHDAELAMTGVYQLDVYNPIDSCHSIALVNVIVHQFPDDVSITGNVPVCAGDSLILDVPHYSDAIYTWTKSGIYYSSDTTLYFQPVTGFNHGTYSCSINIGGCINNSGIENVIVNPVPSTPILSFNALFNSLYALQTQGNYQWNFGFVPLIGQTIDTLQLVQPGYYSVTVSNDFGCDVSSELFFYDPTGIPELPISRLTLQPNPARDNIQVSVPETGILEVRDLAGKCVKENNLQLGVNSISVNELAAGIYFFQFRSNTGVRVAKVIVEHN